MNHSYQLKFLPKRLFFNYYIIFLFFSCLPVIVTQAQCPPNIDFELGDFTGWQCWIGAVSKPGNVNTITWNPTTPVTPDPNRHIVVSGNGRDRYGNFPVSCPNGSGYSIKVGNDAGGSQAEGVSYTFTIPAGQDIFTLTYFYAVVLHEGTHAEWEQARMILTVENITDGTPLPCPIAPFIVGNGLPGFINSNVPPPPGVSAGPIIYKPWAAASLNLDGLAGKTIRIFIKTADCTNSGHFGYAYFDIASQCTSAFTGATFCPDDTAVSVTAPYGYQDYQWWNGTHTIQLGSQQTLVLNPPPLAGDSLIVDLTPFNGYGCASQLKAYLFDTLTVQANAGPDRETCDNNPVQLGVTPIPGRIYKWTPAIGLSNPNIANPIATPTASTTYTLTVTNSGGGCATPDVVNVAVDVVSDSLEFIGAASYCNGSGQSAALKVLPHDNIQWFKDNAPIPGANQTLLNITQTGAYYAIVSSTAGCSRTTKIQQVNIYDAPAASFVSNSTQQCFANNQFVFTNGSSVASGALQYTWDMGDGTIETTRNVTHNYATAGNFTVKLLVTATGGCKDSSQFVVTVLPGATAGFAINKTTQCFKNHQFTFTNTSISAANTIQYDWNLGDGTLLTTKDVIHSYAVPGTYTITLTATAPGGCGNDSSFTVTVYPSPIAGFGINNNPQCFPGHQFVLTNNSTIYSGAMQYNWNMGDGTINTTTNVNYKYANAGSYTVKLLVDAAGGCKDSTLLDVIVHPVPSADFSIETVCENLRVPVYNRTFNNTTSTVNYFWDFGNGHLDNTKTPTYSYPVGGKYSVSLSVSTAQCPVSFDTKIIDVTIDVPEKGIVYTDKDAAFNFPEPLTARAIGNSAIWTPPTSLNNRFSYTPSFTGITPQLYTIQLKTASGCVTVDTQFVKTHKKIEIYVPTGFTPNGNGINDRLRPVLIGFEKVNYFRIYNRWGKLLFSMNSDQPGWDGKVKGQPAEMQSIVWMIEAVDVDGVIHNKQGTTVIIR